MLLLVTSVFGCGDAGGPGTDEIPPSINISAPADRSLVTSSSFEIRGSLDGSVTAIQVFIDGVLLGPATRGDEADEWQVVAGRVSVTPGLHRISATSEGEFGGGSASNWVFYDDTGTLDFRDRPGARLPGE